METARTYYVQNINPGHLGVTESDTTKLAFLFFLTISTFVAIIKVGTLVSLPCHLGNEGDKNTSKHIRES